MTRNPFYDPPDSSWYKYFCSYSSSQKPSYKISEVPFESYSTESYKKKDSPKSMAGTFIDDIIRCSQELDPDDIFKSKTELSRNRIDLLLQLIEQQEHTKYDNIASLYRDLFMLDRLERERPFPDNYRQDSIWLKLKEDKLKIYDSIRKEQANHTKDMSFISKDLIDCLLTYKKMKTKEKMFDE